MGTIAAETGMDKSLAMSLNLALEEAVSNVILYAYPDGASGLVDVEAIIWKDHIDFIVSDNGVPFDPTTGGNPDLTLDVKERPVGGLGIYLVKSIMDHVAYSRREGKNILSMTKKL
jgi:anti-sigma regulatory factor (Ser/Thr protein kinase)